MPLNIPVPKTFLESFLETRKQGVAENLARAQAEEAHSKAQQSRILSQLLGGAQGENVSGGATQSPMSMQKALMLSGVLKFPTQVVEGNLITPFGVYKVGESPTEKGARETSQATQKEQTGSDIKQSEKLRDSYHALRESYGMYKELERLLQKNPSLTGLGPNIQRKLKISKDPDLAAFQGTAGKLQATLGRLASQRGGAAVINWTESVKPHSGNTGKFNMGLIKQGLKDLEREYKNIAEENKSIGGKPFKPLSETYESSDVVKMIRPDGKEVPVHVSNIDTAKNKYNYRMAE